MKVYKRASGGTETLLFETQTEEINATVNQLYNITSVQSEFTILATDRIVIKYYGRTTSVLSPIITIVHSGTDNASHVDTPFQTLHNDLAGIQGGLTTERNHLSDAEKALITTNESDIIVVEGRATVNEEDIDTLEKVILLTYDTAGKFYATVDNFALTTYRKLDILFPNTLTDLSTNVSISLTGIAGTYKDLVYDDTENNVIVSHTQDLKTDVYYDSVQFMMKGETLLPLPLTFDSSVNSTYGLGKPIKGIPTLKSIEGLTLNQVLKNGDFSNGLLTPFLSTGTSVPVITNTIASFTATGANGRMYQQHGYTTSRLLVARVKASSPLVGLGETSGVVDFHSGSGNFEILKAVSTSGTGYVSVVDTNASGWAEVEVDWVMVIPFENTPLISKIESEIFNIVDTNTYIEGIKVLSNPSIYSVGVNELDKENTNVLEAYLNASGVISSLAATRTLYIPCLPSTSYNVSKSTVTARFGIAFTNIEPDIGVAHTGLVQDNGAITLTSTSASDSKYIAVYFYTSSADTLTIFRSIDMLQIEQGITDTPYKNNNNDTFQLTNFDGLSVGTNVRDKAYLDNGDWFKDQYVGIALAVAIGDVIDTTAIPTIKETTGVFYAVDTVNNENQYGVYGDTLTLTGTATVYFQLADIVNSELEYTGALIQESTTTLIQSTANGLATEYDIEFALNHKAQTALHSEMLKGLRDDVDENNSAGVFAYLDTPSNTTCTLADTWYPILGTFVNNLARNFGVATVVTPGIKYTGSKPKFFEIDYHGTLSGDSSGITTDLGVKKNGVFITGSQMGVFLKFVGEEQVLSGTCVVELEPNDEIQLVVMADTAGDIITVEHYTTTIREF